jgi:TRAP-type mannitol/chloroaromatic compound transport system permease large subunit
VSWLAANLAPLMFGGLALFLFTGVPVAFALMACGLTFALIGIAAGVLPPQLMGALPLRVFGIVSSELLLAIPFFTFMGMVLQRSGMAEDLLETIGQVFGPVRGGLALAVVFVGALLGATTGVVAASVISMGLISLPVMLRHGYNPRIASGVIVASGTLALVVPPSLVLIVVADQLGTSVGDMYAGALLPAALVVGLYAALVGVLALCKPQWMPALPPASRTFREANGSSGYRSLLVLFVISALAAWALLRGYPAFLRWMGREFAPPADEVLMVGLAGGVLCAFLLALLDAALRLHCLSGLTRKVAFVLIPPLILIFLVLGTIFLGVATPTEGGALGAVGAVVLAASRRRPTWREGARALLDATKLSTLVMFVLIGSTVFSLVFQGADGSLWVERLFVDLPGGATGFLLVVTLLIFVLGFFLDFFEIAFILLPLLAPVAHKLGIDVVWFGVLVGINLQTSFMTPPFGFSLFFLRGVAPQQDYADPRTGRLMRHVPTSDIYLGVLPFVAVQVLVMLLIIVFPSLVQRADARVRMDAPAVERALRRMAPPAPALPASDPVQLLLDSLRKPNR